MGAIAIPRARESYARLVSTLLDQLFADDEFFASIRPIRNIMKKRRPLAWLVAALVLSGCAHSIRIVPDAPPPESPGSPQSQASVGVLH